MQDERNTPQDEDEVEAHRRVPAGPEEPGRNALDEDDDEVEAHSKRWGPAESKRWEPSE